MANIIGNFNSVYFASKKPLNTRNIFSFIDKAVLNMKNKEFYKLLKKNKSTSNSGFTLTELLTGLIMSIFVVGALGFGLMQILRVTQKGNSETTARNESARALDFISDEMRRAEFIEVDTSLTNINNVDGSGGVASSYTTLTKDDGSGGTTNIKPALALKIPGVSERIVYTVAPPQTDTWKGPLVIYRWGPPLDSNGNYTNETNVANWTSVALVDGVSDKDVTAVGCDIDGTAGDDTYQGFYACVVDDDGDSTAGETEDSDGQAITAHLYFTGETKGADGVTTSTYSADSIATARSSAAPGNNSPDLLPNVTSATRIDSEFACRADGTNWDMRTDFGEDLDNPGSYLKWEDSGARRPQPIKITGDTLVISSIPRNITGDCLNSRIGNGREGNTDVQDFAGNKDLGSGEAWKDQTDVVAISHQIDFNDPTTFNGDKEGTCDSDNICTGSNGGKVNTKKSDDTKEVNKSVRMLKRGSIVPDYGGYDANGNGVLDSGDQKSLGEFLHNQSPSLADKAPNGTDAEGNTIYEYTINNQLRPDERIIGFEVGQTDDSGSTPGFDLQDNIFILRSDKFNDEYDYTPIP